MLWTQIKTYLYAAVTFLIAMLGGYALYQKEQAEDAEEALAQKERELEGAKAKTEEKERARKEEQNQNVNVIESEKEKAETSGKIDDDLDQSETVDVETKL